MISKIINSKKIKIKKIINSIERLEIKIDLNLPERRDKNKENTSEKM